MIKHDRANANNSNCLLEISQYSAFLYLERWTIHSILGRAAFTYLLLVQSKIIKKKFAPISDGRYVCGRVATCLFISWLNKISHSGSMASIFRSFI